MSALRATFALLLASSLLVCWAALDRPTPPQSPPAEQLPAALVQHAARTTAAAPRFVPNQGQWPVAVAYAVLGDSPAWLHADGHTVRLARHAARPTGAFDVALAIAPPRPEVSGCVIRTRVLGAGSEVAATNFAPGAQLPGQHHFLRGSDPAAWHCEVPAFAEVRQRDVLPGIDLLYRPLPGNARGPFEYDLLLAPGADLQQFVAEVEGIEALSIDADGQLVLHASTPDGPIELLQQAPIAWQDTPAGRRPLPVQFRLLGARQFGFVAEQLDARFSATVDPGVVWSSYLGGGGVDSINDLAWRPGQGLWVAGWAGSTDFPTTPGAYRQTGGRDGFVARLSEDGSTLLQATYLGGSDVDEIRGIDVGAALEPVVVGFTRSANFPVTQGAYQPNYGGASLVVDLGDAFVTRLAANGASLVGSTYLGGMFDDIAEAVVVDGAGHACVTGWTSSGNFPTTAGSWQPALGGPLTLQTDGFVARLTPDCRSAAYCTYIGGTLPDQLLAIAVDAATGAVVVAGWTVSSNFPTTGTAYRTSNSGGVDMVAVRLNPAGSQAQFSTYLGGLQTDLANAVALAADGSVWIGGLSNSTNFPTTPGASQRNLAGGYDGALCRLNSNGTNLLHATLLGGFGDDQIRGVAVRGDDVLAVGETSGGLAVTVDAFQPDFGGGSLDGFFARYQGSQVALTYATYCGGAAQDVLSRVAMASSGLAMVSGWSFAADFPTTPGVVQTQLRGAEDGVLMQWDLLTDLGDSVEVAAAPAAAVQVVASGAHDVLLIRVNNRALRPVQLESLRTLLLGRAAIPAFARNLRAYLEDAPAPTGERLVGGPWPLSGQRAELDLPLSGAWIPASSSAIVRLRVELVADPTGATVELGALTLDANAFTLRAAGAGSGPSVRVLGNGRVEGPVLVAGALPGDADGDGLWSAVDLRQLCRRFGQLDRAVDTDGDGVLTLADAVATRAVLLGRGTVVVAPSVLSRGDWFAVTGVFPPTAVVEATLGGRSLPLGRILPRELSLRVEANQTPGTQELRLWLDGRALLVQTVQVQ